MNVKEEILKLKKQNKTYKEIAEALNVPIGTFKSTCCRYRVYTRDLLRRD